MNLSKLHAIYLLVCASLLPPAFAGDFFVKDGFFSQPRPISFELFQKFPSSDLFGGYPLIPLGNELSAVRLKTVPSTLGTPLGYGYFFDIRDDKFFASVDIEANLQPGQGSDWIDEPCKRDIFLWKRSIGGAFRDVNCATINHITAFWVRPTGDFQQLLVAVRQRKLDIPPTVIQMVFTIYTSSSRRIAYKINFNPEFFGFARDSENLWGASSWHKSFSSKDAGKTAFIARAAEWATLVQDRMSSALSQDPTAFQGIPEIEGFLKHMSTKQGNAEATSVNSL